MKYLLLILSLSFIQSATAQLTSNLQTKCIIISGFKTDERAPFKFYQDKIVADTINLEHMKCEVFDSYDSLNKKLLDKGFIKNGEKIVLIQAAHGDQGGTVTCDKQEEQPETIAKTLNIIGSTNKLFFINQSCYSGDFFAQWMSGKYSDPKSLIHSNLCMIASSGFNNTSSGTNGLAQILNKYDPNQNKPLQVFNNSYQGLFSGAAWEQSRFFNVLPAFYAVNGLNYFSGFDTKKYCNPSFKTYYSCSFYLADYAKFIAINDSYGTIAQSDLKNAFINYEQEELAIFKISDERVREVKYCEGFWKKFIESADSFTLNDFAAIHLSKDKKNIQCISTSSHFLEKLNKFSDYGMSPLDLYLIEFSQVTYRIRNHKGCDKAPYYYDLLTEAVLNNSKKKADLLRSEIIRHIYEIITSGISLGEYIDSGSALKIYNQHLLFLPAKSEMDKKRIKACNDF